MNNKELMAVSVNNNILYINFEIFRNLFESSHIYYKKEYQDALRNKRIRLKILQKLAREANIPYALFFAPKKLVEKQIERYQKELFKGVDNGLFSISGRGNIDIRDVSLVIKDILQRQKILRKGFPNEEDNKIRGMLKGSTDDISIQARKLTKIIGFDLETFRRFSGKEKAYNYLVDLFESNNVLVSRSRPGAMPQSINKKVSFSGLAVRDKKFPTIFLCANDETMIGDPTGRRIFTLFLLLVCIAKDKFLPVSYNSRSREIISVDEYRIVEEILMPEMEFTGIEVSDIELVNQFASLCKITPRATLARLRRLGGVSESDYNIFCEYLDQKYIKDKKNSNHPFAVSVYTKIKTYCGLEFTRRVFLMYDAGVLSRGEMRRLLLFNKKPSGFLEALRSHL